MQNQDQIFLMCQQVAEACFITLKKTAFIQNHHTLDGYLHELAEFSAFRLRKIKLPVDWWQQDLGPLLGFDKKTNEPYALIPRANGDYQIISSEKIEILTAKTAESLSEDAYFFYRILPDNKSISLSELLRFSLKGKYKEVIRIFIMQLLLAGFGLFIPVATGIILDDIVPNADRQLLTQWVIGLIIVIFSMGLFGLAQMFGLLRLRLQINISMQAAIWDRLFRLPTPFFQQFLAGDLEFRASSIDRIQQSLTTSMLVTIISGIFSIITLLLIFYYDWLIALVTLGLALFAAAIFGVTIIFQLKYSRSMFMIQGLLNGFVLQLISGITKLRSMHREWLAFTKWRKKFIKNIDFLSKFKMVNIKANVFFTIFSLFSIILLFLTVFNRIGHSLTFGKFIIINAAFGQFFAAIFAMFAVFSNLVLIIPLYQRAKIILQELPEKTYQKLDPGQLSGNIIFKDISFRYQENSELILQDINLEILPKQTIAFVGPSGSGKSTLLRLLLGFNEPETGGLKYGTQNLAHLNILKVREQYGVVLQNSNLIPGNLWENIVGKNDLSENEVWEILNIVALDEEIAALPMGLQTLITEGGKTFSAGQKQRLLLARALAQKPKILLLDEATSTLDNKTEHLIFKNLTKFPITKIVVAHRLSTIKQADYIYVLDRGRIVQCGKYDELLTQAGLFAELVKN